MIQFLFLVLFVWMPVLTADGQGSTKSNPPDRGAAKPNNSTNTPETNTPKQPVSPLEKKTPQTAVDKVAEADRLVANSASAPVDPRKYVIGAEDILMVRVWREPEISGLMAVRPDGRISMQLVGEVEAAGLTPDKLSAAISDRLSKLMTHPEVSVAVQQVNSKRYYINGEVLKPGAYPLVVPTRVLEALVNAGGFREFANLKKITILRGGQKYRFNYKEVIDGKNQEQNIFLEPSDQIIVP